MNVTTKIPRTPALSQRERENCRQSVGVSCDRINRQQNFASPSPWGEGWGEGNCAQILPKFVLGAARVSIFCLLLAGCATSHPSSSSRAFDFSRDTFAFANELTWDYGYDDDGHWTAKARDPKPDYTLHCFVVARTAEQFFKFAKFDSQQPAVNPENYRRLIHRVVTTSPRKSLPDSQKIVIPGYADLKAFSAAHQKLLKEECGSARQSYFQRGNWRMIFPFSRSEQEKMVTQLKDSVRRDGIALAHLVRFPSLAINHAILLYDERDSGENIEFTAYDPNDPSHPITLTYERGHRTFFLPVTKYYPGGRVDAYQIYHRWNY